MIKKIIYLLVIEFMLISCTCDIPLSPKEVEKNPNVLVSLRTDMIRATSSKSPYYASYYPICVKFVEIVTMDRWNSLKILNVKFLENIKDYKSTNSKGVILLNEAIPTYNSDLNPNYIKIYYD